MEGIQRSDRALGTIIAPALGIAFYWTMFTRSYYGRLFSANLGSVSFIQICYTSFLVLTAVLAIGALFNGAHIGRLLERKPRAGILLLVANTCGNALIVFAGHAYGDTLSEAFGIVLFSMGFLTASLVWGHLLVSRFEIRDGILAISLGFFLSRLLLLVCTPVKPVSLGLALLTPMATGIVWYICRGRMPVLRKPSLGEVNAHQAEQAPDVHYLQLALVVLGVLFASCSLMLGTLNVNPIETTTDSAWMMEKVTSMTISAVVALICILPHKTTFRSYFRMVALGACVVLLALLLVIATLQQDWLTMGTRTIPSARNCIELFVWIALLTASLHQTAHSPMKYFAAFVVFDVISSFLAMIAVPVALSSGNIQTVNYVFSFSMVLFILALVAYAITEIRNLTFKAIHERQPQAPSVLRTDTHEACEQLGKSHGLTPREIEVAMGLVDGKSANEIAEMLYISPNTTRTHIKNLYTKLDVHSKYDLMNLAYQSTEDQPPE